MSASVPNPVPTPPAPRVYYRTVFTVYWEDASPSTELFYLIGPVQFSPVSIRTMEQFILTQMQDWYSPRALTVIYVTHGAVEMSAADIAAAGWRVIDLLTIPGATSTPTPAWDRAPV